MLLALIWSVPVLLGAMFYLSYWQPFLGEFDLSPEENDLRARWYAKWGPAFASIGAGVILLGTPGWWWPSAIVIGCYCSGRIGGELGLWARRRKQE